MLGIRLQVWFLLSKEKENGGWMLEGGRGSGVATSVDFPLCSARQAVCTSKTDLPWNPPPFLTQKRILWLTFLQLEQVSTSHTAARASETVGTEEWLEGGNRNSSSCSSRLMISALA